MSDGAITARIVNCESMVTGRAGDRTYRGEHCVVNVRGESGEVDRGALRIKVWDDEDQGRRAVMHTGVMRTTSISGKPHPSQFDSAQHVLAAFDAFRESGVALGGFGRGHSGTHTTLTDGHRSFAQELDVSRERPRRSLAEHWRDLGAGWNARGIPREWMYYSPGAPVGMKPYDPES